MTVQHEAKEETIRPTGLLLRRTEQIVIGFSVLFCLASMAVYFVQQGGMRGRLIDVERPNPQTITFQLDVNTARWPELTQLPNVGETLARRIVAHRDLHGRFSTLDDLEQVEGIGPRTISQIKPFLLPLADRERVAGPLP